MLSFPTFWWGNVNELLPMGREFRWRSSEDFSLSEKHTFCK
ncbi:hypothetical protein LEP1GSC024_1143 [Leptospira noguchii str. 2001034031]|uniref:Uncharacterized protein n=1 Tax=Leptospira noguchii str. 2001034031 TaxID=1193053 RepID=M6YVX4_9LEPT|nr:hypothetical protein LEP1GSC024_1143 [Leptospira noguchii str. 2001034031]